MPDYLGHVCMANALHLECCYENVDTGLLPYRRGHRGANTTGKSCFSYHATSGNMTQMQCYAYTVLNVSGLRKQGMWAHDFILF